MSLTVSSPSPALATASALGPAAALGPASPPATRARRTPGPSASTPATPSAPLPTPRLELSVGTAVTRYLALASALPGTAIHYAVKANPHPVLLRALAQAGCRFDVASPTEVRAALAAGAPASHLVHSNPVARRDHLAEAYSLGVRLFVLDSAGEVDKLAEAAPGSSVLVRIVTSGSGSDWPLSRKYGCTVDEAVGLLVAAGRLGLDAAGVSFHVGSQQRDPQAWRAPIHSAATVFSRVRAAGLHPWLLDLGGGFPARLDTEPQPVADYGRAIDRHLTEAFGADRPRTLVEPGRGVVGDAGTVVTSVVGVVDRGGSRWVFVDAGVFTGPGRDARRGDPLPARDAGCHRAVRSVRARRADLRQCRRALRDHPGLAAAVARRGRRAAHPRRRCLLELLLDRRVQRVRTTAHRRHPLSSGRVVRRALTVSRGRGRCRCRPCCGSGSASTVNDGASESSTTVPPAATAAAMRASTPCVPESTNRSRQGRRPVPVVTYWSILGRPRNI